MIDNAHYESRLLLPAFSSPEATAPLGILAVATPRLRAAYQVKIIDSTITSDLQKRVPEELGDALCLGVSPVIGPMIQETVQIARKAKQFYPDKPAVLGGWHPSPLPRQTLAADDINIVKKLSSKSSSESKRASPWKASLEPDTHKTAGLCPRASSRDK